MFVSVVIPAFNEEGNILPTAERTIRALRDHKFTGEIVFVDDGSSDSTWSEMQQASEEYPDVKIHRHPKNRGLSYALMTGFRHMQGDIAVFIPADLQFSPEEVIPRMVKKFSEGYDVVLGYYSEETNRSRGLRGIASGFNNFLIRTLFGVRVKRLNAVRSFRREVLQDMNLRSEWHSMMVPIAASQGWRIGEVPVTLYERQRGVSKFRAKAYFYALFDLLSLRLLLTFENRPMSLFGLTALGLLLFSFAGIIYMLFEWFFRQLDLFRPLLVISGGALIAGLLLLLIGFLAEMIVSQSELIREQQIHLNELRSELGEQRHLLKQLLQNKINVEVIRDNNDQFNNSL